MIFLNNSAGEYDNDVRVMTLAFFPGEKIVTDDTKKALCRMRINVCVEDKMAVSVNIDEAVYTESISIGGRDRKDIRDELKRVLYGIFSDYTGKTLPWGTLTGIRPVKIPLGMLESGCEDGEILKCLKERYLVSDAKSRLSLTVAHTEQRLLSSIDYSNGYSLYVGIPFCPTTCLYCSFTSYPISMFRDKVDMYLDALIKELKFLGRHLSGKKADSVYIGGGTPTTLNATQLHRLIGAIEDNFDLGNLSEFTVEAGRPDSIDPDRLRAIKSHGIDRISINPQTMNQRTLDIIGRRHTVEDVVRAFNEARDAGFGNINMDMIVGLCDETMDDVKHTLDCIAALSPDSLTVHSLAVKRAARLNIEKDAYAQYSAVNTSEIMDMTYNYAESMGLLPYYLYRQKNMAGNYENVGYAKPGKEGVYNILIMEEKQSIYAAGANAQSKIVYTDPVRVDRIENVKNVTEYIDRVDEMIERKRMYFDGII